MNMLMLTTPNQNQTVSSMSKIIQSKRVRKRRHLDGEHINSIYSSNFLKNKSPKIKYKLDIKPNKNKNEKYGTKGYGEV